MGHPGLLFVGSVSQDTTCNLETVLACTDTFVSVVSQGQHVMDELDGHLDAIRELFYRALMAAPPQPMSPPPLPAVKMEPTEEDFHECVEGLDVASTVLPPGADDGKRRKLGPVPLEKKQADDDFAAAAGDVSKKEGGEPEAKERAGSSDGGSACELIQCLKTIVKDQMMRQSSKASAPRTPPRLGPDDATKGVVVKITLPIGAKKKA